MSVVNTSPNNRGFLTPPDKHSWTRTLVANSHASPSPAQPYDQLIGSLDNSTYAEFWNRLDTNRHSPIQSKNAHAQTADAPMPAAVGTTLSCVSTERCLKPGPTPPPTSAVAQSDSVKTSDMHGASCTTDPSLAEKHAADDMSADDLIPKDTQPCKRFKQDAS